MAKEPRPQDKLEPLSSAGIRQTFLDFFAARDHAIVPSAPLVPGGDETLLFTNAGMVQFKDVFLGLGTRAYTRAADSQKCMRVAGKHNDLDDVGRDDTHHTFFEMLGNWSFGDYYKAEAIAWAWELLTDVWGLPKERFYATCFEDEMGEIPRDDEAADIWRSQPGFIPEHVLFFGREENFWEMAETGPCGPDSEIHFDRGEDYCEKRGEPGHVCRVNGDCQRFLELWNLVFIQYNRTGPNTLEPLPSKHVDTGMGFERLVAVLQDVDSNYKTDLFTPMLERVQELTGHNADQRQELITPYRVIADHARAAAFLIADGVVPGNSGRNYVCRMIIRRASRFGSYIGFDRPFLAEIGQVVIENYGTVYPELQRNQKAILRMITDEEHRFQRTVEAGVAHLMDQLEGLKGEERTTLSGDSAFDLYATYGLPLEITRDIAREHGFSVDESGFSKALEAHRQVSSAGIGAAAQIGEVELYQELAAQLKEGGALPEAGVRHDPYAGLECECPVIALVVDGEVVEQASPGDRVSVVLPETHFYVEAGGQVSDTGSIVSVGEPRWSIEVEDVEVPVSGLVTHTGRVQAGKPRVGDRAIAGVHEGRRLDIMRNHTATHLLHAALRRTLGEHARQQGSLVAPDRLRFDFNHPKPMTPEEVQSVERIVNQQILANRPLQIGLEPQRQAVERGAIALFGEAYADTVRTVRIGEEPFSYELCGGTHVAETGIIGPFLIVNETSVAAGIRRVEALTGRAALEYIRDRLRQQARIASMLETSPDGLLERIQTLQQERDELVRQLQSARARLALAEYDRLRPEHVDGVTVLTGEITDAPSDVLRQLADRFRTEHESGVAVLASSPQDKPVFVAAVSQDLVSRGLHAGELVQAVAQAVGGGGGGRPTLAQAGGVDTAGIPEALSLVRGWIRAHLD